MQRNKKNFALSPSGGIAYDSRNEMFCLIIYKWKFKSLKIVLSFMNCYKLIIIRRIF